MLNFRQECLQCLVKVVGKLQDKCPLKFTIVRNIACLDPRRIHQEPEKCIKQMKAVVQTFLQGKQLTGGIPAGKNIYMCRESRSVKFIEGHVLKVLLMVFHIFTIWSAMC